jgi:phosphoribosylglycinamide formyltransferase-1
VENDLDAGPIIIQAATPVFEDDDEDTLMPRIHAMEHRIYPQAVAWLAENRLVANGRTVRLLPKGDAPARLAAAQTGVLVYPPFEEGF